MTTYIAFNPVPDGTPPFTSNFTLDGANYLGSAIWNFAVQRWYFSLTDSSGNIVWMGPLIGSPLNYDIPLALGIFQNSTILYRTNTGNFEVNP